MRTPPDRAPCGLRRTWPADRSLAGTPAGPRTRGRPTDPRRETPVSAACGTSVRPPTRAWPLPEPGGPKRARCRQNPRSERRALRWRPWARRGARRDSSTFAAATARDPAASGAASPPAIRPRGSASRRRSSSLRRSTGPPGTPPGRSAARNRRTGPAERRRRGRPSRATRTPSGCRPLVPGEQNPWGLRRSWRGRRRHPIPGGGSMGSSRPDR